MAQPSVRPRAEHRARDRDGNCRRAAAEQCEQRAGTRAGERPAEPEDRAPRGVAHPRAEVVRGNRDRLAAERAPPAPLEELHADDRRRQRGGEDPEHVETLEPEHLLDAEPGDRLTLGQHDAEHRAGEQVDPEPRCGRIARGRAAELVGVFGVALDVGARLRGRRHRASPSTSGRSTKVPSSPPAKNPPSAMNDGFSRLATPEMPCPDVQSPAYAVPKPTRNPPPTMTIHPRIVARLDHANSSRGTRPVSSWMPSDASDVRVDSAIATGSGLPNTRPASAPPTTIPATKARFHPPSRRQS